MEAGLNGALGVGPDILALEQHLTGQDLEILQTAQALKAGECREDLTALTDRLFAWCRDVIGQQKAI